MHHPVVPQVVQFPRSLTIFLQRMQSSDVADQLAISKKALAGSVAGLIKEAIAQHMVPSVTDVEVLTISKLFVILGMSLPAQSKEGSPCIRRKASSRGTDHHLGTTAKARAKEEAMAKAVVHHTRRNSSIRTRRRRKL